MKLIVVEFVEIVISTGNERFEASIKSWISQEIEGKLKGNCGSMIEWSKIAKIRKIWEIVCWSTRQAEVRRSGVESLSNPE